MAIKLFWVMLGGALGSGLRWGVSLWAMRLAGPGFPFGTLAVNLAGSALIGLLAGSWLRGAPGQAAWLLLAVGFCGGFTTFSALSLEMLAMVQRGAGMQAAAYLTASVLGGLLLAAGGMMLARGL